MTAHIIPFPPRAPFVVRVEREQEAWLAICRSMAARRPARCNR
jgi:hypothetical protein